ncbi:MAG: hypothetical protein DRH49_03800 [Candidatus Coatesbacteria bacterium]|nr:MAG: hypothetical protein DRH49_03800 [Candidatus Coatesbacteria bacterium]
MRKVAIILGFVILLSATALSYHDYLWTYEWTGQNFWEKSIIANGHFTFYRESVEEDADSVNDILFPVEAGFAFDKLWSVSAVIPIQKLGGIPEDSEISSFGISNIWMKGKFIPMLGPNISLGPRIGIRLPVGTEGHKVDALAVDAAGLIRLGYVEDFPMVISAQAGLRYELEKDNNKLPSYFYVLAEPGYKVNWRLTTYGVVGFAFPITKGKTAAPETPDGYIEYDGDNHMWFGGKATMKISPSVTADGTFQYRIWEYPSEEGQPDMTKSWFFGAGITANIGL